ncbi:hypothetical protein M7I_4695 [Glarea lozoyensis 74030]|uniref:Uncharacterized protein n=1 Tax=Glarea lozoyensis (strain ATCC 74030 / MF5533) TaxID=1104152 RepID=H0EPV7_GLAL7|nr:hypothetical protein M7I_4695 [Glarea lozoyensis 74030]
MPRPPMRDGEEDMVRRSNESLDAYFARRERSGFKNGVRISGRVGCVSYSMEAFLHWQALRQPMKQETQSTGSLEERNSVIPISARKSGVVEDGSTSLPMEFRDIASTNLDRGQITQLMLSESYLQSATAGDSRPGSYGQTSSLCLKFQKLKSVTIAVDSVVPDPCPDKFSPKMAYDLSNYNWSLTRSCRRDYGRMISAFIVNLEANRRYSPDEIAYLKAEKARVDTVRIVKFNYREPSRSTEYCRRQGPDLVGEAIPVHLGFPWNMNDPPRHR